MLNALPDMCFSFSHHAAPGKYVIAIKHGETGYYPTTYDEPDPEKAKALVDHLNAKLGVSQEQRECMENGSMFGWDTPGAQMKVMGNNNENIEKFLRLLNTAGAITIDDGALLTDSSEVADLTGDPDNEVVHFSWTDGEMEYSDILTEGGIAKGIFDSDGKFVVENSEGEKTVIRFFALEQLRVPEGAIAKLNTSQMYETEFRKADEIELFHNLVADIKTWDVSQYMTIPYELRERIEAALTHNARVTEAEAKSPFSELQQDVAKLYCNGEMAYVHNMQELDGCGDGLFAFLVREAGDASDLPEFLGMLDTARNQLDQLSGDLEKLVGKNIRRPHDGYDQSYGEAEAIAGSKESWHLADGSEAKSYSGKVLGVTAHHVVQSLGKTAVIHHKANLDRAVAADELVNVVYTGKGKGTVGHENAQGMQR